LAEVYFWLLDVTPEKDRDEIRQSQRQWISEVRNSCSSIGCLSEKYERRITYLQDQVPDKLAGNLPLLRAAYRGDPSAVEQTRAALKTCMKNDSTLRDCTVIYVAVENELMEKILEAKKKSMSDCASELGREQAAWMKATLDKCGAESNERGLGGALGAAAYQGCLLDGKISRVAYLKTVFSCGDLKQ